MNIDLKSNPSEEKLIMYAHLLRSIEKQPEIFRKDQDFLKKIFYDVMSIRYSDLSTRELSRLRAKVVFYSGVESGIINQNKGAVI